jgi:hypothetical protein
MIRVGTIRNSGSNQVRRYAHPNPFPNANDADLQSRIFRFGLAASRVLMSR